MGVGSGISCVISSTLAIVLFSGMQMYKNWLAATALRTIFGGYLSSVLFVLVLTGLSNMEMTLFGKNFQTKLFPEVVMCLGIAVAAASMIHRVCITTCLLFSAVGLYYLSNLSQQVYAASSAIGHQPNKKKK